LLLELKQNNFSTEKKRLCVATTHILYNPKRGDIKLAQLLLMFAYIDVIAFKKLALFNQKLRPIYYPVILGGDFNFTVDSKLYQFIKESNLPDYKLLNRNLLSGQLRNSYSCINLENCIPLNFLEINNNSQFKSEVLKRFSDEYDKSKQTEQFQFKNLDEYMLHYQNQTNLNNESLAHSFYFKSVYDHYNVNNSLEITTCLINCKTTVDYIFYHAGESLNSLGDDSHENENKRLNFNSELELLGKLELFTLESFRDICLPNENHPSDHFMLVAKFLLR
jgi:protein angel